MKTLHLNIQDDITPAEAAAISVLLTMIATGFQSPLFSGTDFKVSIDEVQKLHALSIRHWMSQPEPVIVDGKKHYIMETETGHLGLKMN